jgi:hypothetical protein
VSCKTKRRPSLRQISHPRKHPLLDKGPKDAISTNTERRTGSIIAAHAKSFRAIGNGAVIRAVGSITGHIRKKSLLSIVSTVHENGDDGGEGDVFWMSSERDAGAGDKRSKGLFNAAKTPSKKNAFSLPEVTTEEDSLHRSNKEVGEMQIIVEYAAKQNPLLARPSRRWSSLCSALEASQRITTISRNYTRR